MFHLIKLAIYGMLGYAIYEFIRGVLEDRPMPQAIPASGNRPLNRALDQDQGRMNFTGGGSGQAVRTEGTDGGSASHRVGRGVVR